MASNWRRFPSGRLEGGSLIKQGLYNSVQGITSEFWEVVAAANTIDLDAFSFSILSRNLSNTLTISLTAGNFSSVATNISLLNQLAVSNTTFGILSPSVSNQLTMQMLDVVFNTQATDIDFVTANTVALNSASLSMQEREILSSLNMSLTNGVFSLSQQDIDFIISISNTIDLASVLFKFNGTSVNLPLIAALDDLVLNQIISLKLMYLGYSGALNDMLLKYYLNNGAVSTTLNDAEKEWLGGLGFNYENVADSYKFYLNSLGYTGNLSDMLKKFWFDL